MSTTAKQDIDFLVEVIGTGLLESAIDWIKSTLSPEEVFGEKELIAWASNFDPESIFSQSTLESWAENNGYVKE